MLRFYMKNTKIFGGRRAPDTPTGVWVTNFLPPDKKIHQPPLTSDITAHVLKNNVGLKSVSGSYLQLMCRAGLGQNVDGLGFGRF